MRPVALAGHAAIIALLLTGEAAMAETELNATLGLNGGLASNPYGASGNDTASGTVAATFNPNVTFRSPTGALTLGGTVTHTEYFQRYNGTTDYTLTASGGKQFSSTLSANASASYISTVRNGLYPVIDPLTGVPLDPNDPVIVDPAAATSYAQRSKSFNGMLGMSAALSARDSIDLTVRGAGVRFEQGFSLSRSYNTIGGSLNYMREIGTETSIGAGFDLSRTDYRESALGDSSQYMPQILFNTSIAARWKLNATAGVTISDTTGFAGNVSRTSFAGSLGLCYVGDRAHFCMNGSHRVAPSSFSGTSTVTSFGSNFSYKLSLRDSISAGLSYSKARGIQGAGIANSDYLQANVTYSRQILERLSGVASVAYSDTYDSLAPRGANIYGSIGLRYRLGTL